MESTSLEAYFENLSSGRNVCQKLLLLDMIEQSLGSVCSRQLSDWSGIDRSIVNSRLGELEKAGLIVFVGKRVYPPSNRPFKFYRSVNHGC